MTYDAETKAQLAAVIENCLFSFNMMHGKWSAQQNIDAAKVFILSEVEHILELPSLDDGEGDESEE